MNFISCSPNQTKPFDLNEVSLSPNEYFKMPQQSKEGEQYSILKQKPEKVNLLSINDWCEWAQIVKTGENNPIYQEPHVFSSLTLAWLLPNLPARFSGEPRLSSAVQCQSQFQMLKQQCNVAPALWTAAAPARAGSNHCALLLWSSTAE